MPSLPVDPFVDEIVEGARRQRAVVVTAQPGAGKTTRIPPAFVRNGPVLLLQPRRVAARAIAAHIAGERQWTVGREVGWQVRFDRSFTRDTRLLVVTEGILTARLQHDPLLSGFNTIVFDEFHERSIHADIAIALSKQAWRARLDLTLVVMSATLDTERVSRFLDGCPVVEVPGRVYPITTTYRAGQPMADAALEMLSVADGGVLCFQPGAAEIRRTIDTLARRRSDVELVPLHGGLSAAEQDAAIRPSSRRRIIVATNIAQTTLTVPGVTAVVDSGLHKVARYDAERAIDSLDVERISVDAATQRSGRAGRLSAGVACRLWDERDRLRQHDDPEIQRVDLSGPLLDVIAWGGDPLRFEWFEPPPADAVARALELLTRLGVVAGGKLTAIGQQVHRMAVHPRMARIVVAAGGHQKAARAVAVLAERHLIPPRHETTTSDLVSALDDWPTMPPHVHHTAREIARLSGAVAVSELGDDDLRRAILAGYPDRVAQRREPRSARLRLASGTGAILGRESGVIEGEFLVALDLHGSGGSTFVRVASLVDREWLQPNNLEIVHRFDEETGAVKAVAEERYDALVLAETPARADPDVASQLLADRWLRRGPREADRRLVRRLRFAGHHVDLDDLVRTAARGARTIDDVDVSRGVPAQVLQALERDAPTTMPVPSGRTVPLDYAEDGTVSASVKLQELFGLGDTPRIGPACQPVLLALLAPNGRPVQLTRDLRSFWNKTYPDVRKELRGRYPKHPWPDDPWTAQPTRRTKSNRRAE